MPEHGLGFLDVETPDLYGVDYFEHYRALDRTPMGARLNEVRLDLVARYWDGPVTDVGIGGGGFVEAHRSATGWDVNEHAIRWLFDRCCLRDPRSCRVDAVTMWDSIEHMRDPSEILRNVDRWVFVSTPIYATGEAAIASKHYKPGEHLWYFSEFGLVNFMRWQGFRLRESNDLETAVGREGIGSFAFERA